MAIQNTWVLDVIHSLANRGELSSVARTGFISQGRGSVWLELSDGRFWIIYKSRREWEEAGLDKPREKPLLDAIDNYNPSDQFVVTAYSSFGSSFEVTTCLIQLEQQD